jgi:hypothetical protein
MRFAMLVLAIGLAQDVPIQLQWKFKKGQTFKVFSKGWTTTRVRVGEKQDEYVVEQTETVEFHVRVLDAKPSGTMLQFTLSAMDLEVKENNGFKAVLKSKLEGDTPEIDAKGNVAGGEPFDEEEILVLQTLFKNLYVLVIRVRAGGQRLGQKNSKQRRRVQGAGQSQPADLGFDFPADHRPRRPDLLLCRTGLSECPKGSGKEGRDVGNQARVRDEGNRHEGRL